VSRIQRTAVPTIRSPLPLALLLAVAASTSLRADTHRFVPTQFHNTFSFAHPPALRLKPGDRVITSTVDAGGVDKDGRQVAQGPNPQTGPFYIEGAEPGDVLVVRIEKIETNRATAYSSSLLAPYVVDPGSIATRVDREAKRVIWQIDKAAGVARLTDADVRPALTLPLRPMLGCVGVAPARKEAIGTASPGAFGGNMDYAGLTAGVTVMLPVNEPGALLFIGDGHARQGEGEVVGTGLETSMDVEFTVDLVKKKAAAWPRLENDTHVMVLGSARPLLQALQHATTEMQRWLVADYGFSERGAAAFMGQALEYEVANVVDPNFTVVAKVRKSLMPPR
jgi:amidase